MTTFNRLLDALPRTRLGCLSREVPAFRACGVTGFYVAVVVLIGGGLLAGRSPLVLAGLAGVCAASFFVYTYLRMWVTGRETLVLLEHVWFALAASAACLWAVGEPVLPYLDVVAVALCPFLVAGRVGCTLVGCCHGRPSRFGIVYPDRCAADGFAHHLVGVRLFPVPAVEAVALAGIGLAGLCTLPFAAPGRVLVWFLLAYAVTRFGLEGLRGDRRPHLLGLSQARWMAVAEVGAVLAFGESVRPAAVASYALLAGLLLIAVVLGVRWDVRRRLLSDRHVAELRDLTRAATDEAASAVVTQPASRRTGHGASVAVSVSGSSAHVSLSLPWMAVDLPLLCDLAAAAFPELRPDAAALVRGRVLHLSLPCPLPPGPAPQPPGLGTALYSRIVRCEQGVSAPAEKPAEKPPPVPPPTPAPPDPPGRVRAWWFVVNGERDRESRSASDG